MDLQLSDKTIAVGGATSGLGRAVAEALLAEGATVIGIARTQQDLNKMGAVAGAKFIGYAADLTDATAVKHLAAFLNEHKIYACVFNAGGPPTGRVEDLDMNDWDDAYRSTFRWKIQLTNALLPAMKEKAEGRLLFLESVSIKQPIDNLVLSNAMRAAMAGFVKTLSREIGEQGITVNILAPGYHATPRITTVLEKSAEIQGLDLSAVESQFAAETAVKKIGQPADFATMAAFLLSPAANYITGQTITVDGGLVRHITG
ncbi:SDR family oxidoreductase [Neolewinella antarctica]|uniref:3-oxoacyl-[acyl-carrier protein] reductase n=1 Tax=Neolewinella antarctica TaxID=442734 RepID=A0ABX0XI27_9BACT|nr:SDR family oxidoreductase [Neolewinella antarctica]NJC28484.1 3-oxoacyl-[acyl-carrier protein] reductase [Neolewinella antarctica]